MTEVRTIGTIEGGKLNLYNRELFAKQISNLKDCKVEITVKKHFKKRSTEQSRYYWGVVVPMVQDAINGLGNEFTAEETHEFLKARFNAKNIASKDGEAISVPVSTTKLNTVEFVAYLERINLFCSEYFGFSIPEPNSQGEFNYSVLIAQRDPSTNVTVINKAS